MNVESQPLVSVVTPVYNMGSFLPECIESVLAQTYKNIEYIIVNNCSTDNSLEIALSYEKKDSRVRVHNNEKFVGVIENHNIAFSRISTAAKYCKIVSADDWIFADCIMRMVECAEDNSSVSIVGSYQISGSNVLWQGFQYPKAVFSGREICRKMFHDKTFGLGSPTSLLYRADVVRNSAAFYPNPSPHADTSACLKELQSADYGFVYQVLSYERIHVGTQSSTSADINRYSSAYLDDLLQYGPFYLSKDEFDGKLKQRLREYYEYLAVNLFRARGKQFWDYHKSRLDELGFPITRSKLLRALITKGLKVLKRPEQAMKKIFHYS